VRKEFETTRIDRICSGLNCHPSCAFSHTIVGRAAPHFDAMASRWKLPARAALAKEQCGHSSARGTEMPTPGFIKNFSFSNGDVIYGDRDDRKKYKETLESYFWNKRDEFRSDEIQFLCLYGLFKDLFITIDQYNNTSFLAIDTRQNVMVEIDRLIRAKEKENKQPIEMQNLLNMRTYVQALPMDFFDSNKIERNKDHIGPKEGVTKPGASVSMSDVKGIMENYRIRASCKFGLLNLAKALKSDAKIHFVLDSYLKNPTQQGSRMDQVINKTPYVSMDVNRGTNGAVPVTASELRCVYRNWESLGRERVIFYDNMEETDPPWVTYKAQWDAYARYRLEKYLTKAERMKSSKKDLWQFMEIPIRMAKIRVAMNEYNKAADYLKNALRDYEDA
jgi:hypothetical protein